MTTTYSKHDTTDLPVYDDNLARAERLRYLTDPDDPRHQAAMQQKCEVCGATKGRPCWNTIDSEAPLPNRLIHHGRIEVTANEI